MVLGKVAAVMEYGAFVDVGVEKNGLLSKGNISYEDFESVDQVLQPGEKLKVRLDGQLVYTKQSGTLQAQTISACAPFKEAVVLCRCVCWLTVSGRNHVNIWEGTSAECWPSAGLVMKCLLLSRARQHVCGVP